jgi:hypothetical protein
MTPNQLLASATTCAENIALLHLLHNVPTLPSANSMNALSLRHTDYALSTEEERSLVGTLAFLASIKDDPDHIPAVCVRPHPNLAALDVLLAVNKANRNDGHEILQISKEGFERIFGVLSRVGSGE